MCFKFHSYPLNYQVYKSGWLVFGVSAVIALAIVINSCQNKNKAVKTA